MIRNIGPSAERFLVDLGRIHDAAERAQREVSSGVRVASSVDAPDQISGILQLRASIERNVQIRANLSRVKSEVDTAESAIELAVRITESARVLASQGAGTTETQQTRAILAEEARGLLEQLVEVSRTRVEQRYIFSGDRDQDPPYEIDPTAPNGVSRNFAMRASRQVEHPTGTGFTAGKTAEEIFDRRNPDDTIAPENVFAAVCGLSAALENNDQAGIESSLASLRAAGDYLNIQLSFYGNVQRKITEGRDTAARLESRLKVELSDMRDADLTASILDLQQAATHEQAALSARANLPATSLFDFLD